MHAPVNNSIWPWWNYRFLGFHKTIESITEATRQQTLKTFVLKWKEELRKASEKVYCHE